jgi:hypothetical protein
MSGVLESLRNPLERLSVLPTSMSLRADPTSGDVDWAVDVQYFQNDVVTDDGVAWVFVGGPSGETSSLGGSSPSAINDPTVWCPLGAYPPPPAATPSGTATIPLLATSIAVANTAITATSVVMITPVGAENATATRFWVTLNAGVGFSINTQAAPTVGPKDVMWYVVSY